MSEKQEHKRLSRLIAAVKRALRRSDTTVHIMSPQERAALQAQKREETERRAIEWARRQQAQRDAGQDTPPSDVDA